MEAISRKIFVISNITQMGTWTNFWANMFTTFESLVGCFFFSDEEKKVPTKTCIRYNKEISKYYVKLAGVLMKGYG